MGQRRNHLKRHRRSAALDMVRPEERVVSIPLGLNKRATTMSANDGEESVEERLRLGDERWSLMAVLASDYYWQTDENHRLCPFRQEYSGRFNVAPERVEGLTRWEAHPAALSKEQWAEHRADLDARRPFRSLHMEIEADDGRFIWLSVSGTPRLAADGRFLGYHGFGRDITARKEAERLMLRHNETLRQAVAERTRELQCINDDLDAFARQIAHELRTSISHVQGLAQVLETRVGAQLGAADRRLLTLQVTAARQMRDTVDSLLLLARSTTQPMPVAPVDLTAMCHEVRAELPGIERAAPIDWQIQDDMCVSASAASLRLVLVNLLGNAAKFTRHTPRPVVRVWARAGSDGSVTFSVHDNGTGFSMTQASQLFQPFMRLHSGADYPGTGIGLTIVQRVVERHGGRVEASAQPGVGARFDVELPGVKR